MIRLEITKALSGTPLLGGVRLIRMPSGLWVFELSDGQYIPLKVKGSHQEQVVTVNGQTVWHVTILNAREAPWVLPGVASEDEASLHLLIRVQSSKRQKAKS